MSSEQSATPKMLLKIPTKSGSSKGGIGSSKPKSGKSKPKSKLMLTKPKVVKPKSVPGKSKPRPKPGGIGGLGLKPKARSKVTKPIVGGKGPHGAPAPRPTFKKKDEGLVDLEQQFLLRMPPGTAMALRHDVESGAMNLKDKLSIELNGDHRHAFVRYGGQVFNARLMDLACTIETLKSTDRKTFYKTSDICQMLLCKDEDFSSEEEESPKKVKDAKDLKYRWNHGITRPLKNVRKRRFRKTMKKKLYQDQPDIEKEVKRLFRMDNEAIDVKWEVVIEEDEATGPLEEKNVVLAHGDVFNPLNSSEAKKVENAAASENISKFLAEEDIFGDVSSSEEEEEDVDGEINIMDSGEEEATPTKAGLNEEDSMIDDNNDSLSVSMSNKNDDNDDSDASFGGLLMSTTEGATTQESGTSQPGGLQPGAPQPEPKLAAAEPPQFSAKTDMFDSFMSTDPTATDMSEEEIRERMSELSQHMQDLRDRRAQQEMELAMMDSSSLKDRLERELNNIIEEETEKQKEYDSLASMLGIPT